MFTIGLMGMRCRLLEKWGEERERGSEGRAEGKGMVELGIKDKNKGCLPVVGFSRITQFSVGKS